MKGKTRHLAYVVVGLLALTMLMIPLTVGAASDPRELAVIEDAAPFPRTNGTIVVWSRDEDIQAVDIDTQQDIVVAAGPTEQRTPDVDERVVVWAEQSEEGDFNILGRDLATDESFTVASTDADELLPAISGDWVVWVRRDGGFDRLMARDLATMAAPITVRQTPGPTFRIDVRPEIDATRVAWAEIRGNPGFQQDWTLYAQTIGAGSPVAITSGLYQFEPRAPSYDVGGDKVVYSERGALFVYDLPTRTPEMLTEYSAPGIHYPTSDGRYIYFEDQRFSPSTGQTNLGGYDLSTGSLFVAWYDIGTNTYPDVGGGTVVWQASATAETMIGYGGIDQLLPTTPWPNPGMTDPNWTYYPETGHYLGWGFRDYWTRNGGLMVFGFPLTDEFFERNADTGEDYAVQYFERQRFEWHPDKAGTPYEVLLGRLGAELLVFQGRDWEAFPTADPSAPYYMQVTGHAIDPRFWAYWSTHGLELGDPGISFRESLALFGYPLSEPMQETNSDGDTVLTQYFERAVFEWHPDNPDPYKVLLRRLGAEMLDARGW